MSVVKTFWEDPYRTRLITKVRDVDSRWIRLEETIIFSFSGGQESDAGSIDVYPVLGSKWEGRDISYFLPQGHGLLTGQAVELTIDWKRRYKLMRLHFAAELVLELVYQGYGRPEKTGAHIGEDKARLDFVWEGSIAPIIPKIQEKVLWLIAEDHRIVSDFADPETEQRVWAIEGFARVPCGGTHIRRTSEIGNLYLRRNNIGKGKERIEIFLHEEP